MIRKNLIVQKGGVTSITTDSAVTDFKINYAINGGTAVEIEIKRGTRTGGSAVVIPSSVTSAMAEGSGSYTILDTTGVIVYWYGTLTVRDTQANIVPNSRIVRTDSRA